MAWKKGETGNPGGRKKLSPWAKALEIVANESCVVGGVEMKNLRALAKSTFRMAIDGDAAARKEIGDRLDGRPRPSEEEQEAGVEFAALLLEQMQEAVELARADAARLVNPTPSLTHNGGGDE